MTSDYKQNIRIGACCSVLQELGVVANLKTAIQTIGELGFEAVEISMRYARPVVHEAKIIQGICQKYNLEITGLHHVLPDNNFTIFDKKGMISDEFAPSIRSALNTAVAFDTPQINIGMGSTRKLPNVMQKSKAAQVFIETIQQELEQFEQYNLRVAIEIISEQTADFFNAADEIVQYLAILDDKRIGINCDTFQSLCQKLNPVEEIRYALPFLYNIHLSEQNRQTPGDGGIDFEQILSTLYISGYRGSVSIEIKPPSNRYLGTTNPLDDLKKGLLYLKELRQAVLNSQI